MSESTVDISFDSLLSILPTGILSKNSLRGAKRSEDTIRRWMNLDDRIDPARRTAYLINAKRP